MDSTAARQAHPVLAFPANWGVYTDLETIALPPGFARLYYPIEAGLTVRGQVKRNILGAAHTYGLRVAVKEDKGLLESLYRFTFVGPEAPVRAFHAALQTWAKDVGATNEHPELTEL